MRTLLVALLVAACVLADTEFEIAVNFSDKNRDFFKARLTSVNAVSSPVPTLPLSGLGWVSASASGSVLNTSVSADVIAALHVTGGSVYGMLPYPPMSFGTYVSGTASFDPLYFFKAIAGQGSAEFNAGLIGFVVPGLIEVDPKGKFVAGIPFGQDWTTLSKIEGSQAGISVYRAGVKDETKAQIYEYVIASDVAGYLKFANTPVSPNSLEVIYQINDYQYADKKNHLELVVATAVVTAEGKGQVDLDIALNKLTQDFSTYASLRAEATVDSKSASVKIKAAADLEDAYKLSDTIKGYVEGAFKTRGEVSIDYKKIAFPAGASKIIYDPAIGAGKNVYNSASSVVLSIFAVLLAVFLLF